MRNVCRLFSRILVISRLQYENVFLKETGTVLGDNFYTVFCFVIANRRNDKVQFYTTLNQPREPTSKRSLTTLVGCKKTYFP